MCKTHLAYSHAHTALSYHVLNREIPLLCKLKGKLSLSVRPVVFRSIPAAHEAVLQDGGASFSIRMCTVLMTYEKPLRVTMLGLSSELIHNVTSWA